MTTARALRTRARLLQTAAKRFAADGYHGTSYNSLIAASGMSKGAYYFHFASKKELALEVYRTKQAEVLRAALAAAGREKSPLERLFLILRARAEAFAEDRSLRCLPRLSTDFSRDPELATSVADLHANATEPFALLLWEAKREGELREEVDPDAAARTIFAAIVGVDEVSERESRGKDLIERSRDFWALLRLALTGPRGNTPGREKEG